MRAGSLRHRIIIQSKQKTPDGEGGWTYTWEDMAEDWANVMPLRAEEKLQYQQVNVQASHEITMRYRPDINNELRVVYNGRYFDIVELINVGERNRELKLICVEQAG